MLASSPKRVCASAQSLAEQNVETKASTALQNHLVLEKISSFLSVTDLKQFRRVSQTWNQESLSAIRNKVHCIKFSKSTPEEMRNLIELISNNISGFPCVDFRFSSKLGSSDPTLFNNILSVISSFAMELDLKIKDFKSPIGGNNMVFSNLKALKLSEVSSDSDPDQTLETLRCFHFMLQSAPELEKIHVKIESNKNKSISASFVETIASYSSIQTVNDLSLTLDLSNDLLLQLARLGFRLNKLRLRFNLRTEFTPENFKAFLESQQNSLEELTLEKWNYISGREPTLVFPRMEKVKVFKFQMIQANVSELSFAKQFPALKHLKFSSFFGLTNGNDEMILHRNMEPLNTLVSLVLSTSFDEFEVLDQVARIFPMLKKLEVGVPNAVTRTVGRGMNNLEKLILHVESMRCMIDARNIFNELMTGYTKDELDILEKEWSDSTNFQKLRMNKEPAEIFKQLKVLQLHQAKLTDVLCLLGPLRMTSLECLDLRWSPDSQISQHILEQMKERYRVLINDNCVLNAVENMKQTN